MRERASISQPAVSQRAEGTRRLYALDVTGVDAAQAWLARLAASLDPFAQPMDALATEVARGRRTRPAPPDTGEADADQDRRPA